MLLAEQLPQDSWSNPQMVIVPHQLVSWSTMAGKLKRYPSTRTGGTKILMLWPRRDRPSVSEFLPTILSRSWGHPKMRKCISAKVTDTKLRKWVRNIQQGKEFLIGTVHNKTKSLVGTKPNTNLLIKPTLTLILTLFSCFMLLWAPSHDLQSS